MGRTPCCPKEGLNRGPWTPTEDSLLVDYIQAHGEGQWRSLPKKAGLLRCGKSCRLRWMNYLRPDIKRGDIRPDEEDLIIRLHSLLGNRWSLIAKRLPGRTDNEIKNYWNAHLHKKLNQPPNQFDQDSKMARTSADLQKGTATTTKTIIHIPKPVRVSSFPVAKRNESSNSVESALSVHEGVSVAEAHAIDEYLQLLQAEDCIQLRSYDSLLT